MAENQIVLDVWRALAVALALGCAGASMRWVWKAILRQMRAEIREAAQPNSDSLEEAITKKIDELSDRNDHQHTENAERLQHIEERVAVVEANTKIHADRLDSGAGRMAAIFKSLEQLQTDVSALRSDPPTPPQPSQPSEETP